MAYLLDEKKFINENIFHYEERLNSQYSRFIDKTPTFVTYYAINNVESTVDLGFQTIERVLGPGSPLKFKAVNDFPLYGLDPILLDLSDADQGLDTSYDGELVVLPNTIKPLPNDLFTISYLNKNYLFMVTQVAYGTIKSNDFYRLSFTVRSLDEVSKTQLLSQTNEGYSCIFTNIGTKENCIIRNDIVEKLLKLNEIYKNVAERYKIFFYSSRYNSFIYQENGVKYYDKYMSTFLNNYDLFKQKNDYSSTLVNIEGVNPIFPMTYDNSFYRALELESKPYVKDAYVYSLENILTFTSIFVFYRDTSVKSISLDASAGIPYIPNDLITAIKTGVLTTLTDIKKKTIASFFNDALKTVDGFDLISLANFPTFMDLGFETYILIPILLYVMKTQYHKFMAVH